MDIEIRLAKIEENEKIIQLQTDSIEKLASQDYTSLQIESLVKTQALLRFKDEIIFVAVLVEKIVGFASIHIHKPEIYGLFVSPEFARQGIGTKLLETIEKIAIQKKHKFIYVNSSLTAKVFYRKRGYKKMWESGFYSEREIWINCVLMKKRLMPYTKVERENQNIVYFVGFLIIIIIIAIFLSFI